jgi:hypothetical protein
MAFTYRISLQITHPSADPDDIVQQIGRTAVRSWAVGEPRQTPAGTPLQGVQRETYCAFDIGRGDDRELARLLRQAVANLDGARSLFRDLRDTGGSINLYVTWTTGERGEIFDAALLSSIARLGIDLGIEPLSAI